MRLFRRDTDPAPAEPVGASLIPPRTTLGRAEALPTVFACVTAITHTACQARITTEVAGAPTPAPEWLRRPDRLNGGHRPRAMLERAVTDLGLRGVGGWYATPVGSLSWRLDPIGASRWGCRFRSDHSRAWTVDGRGYPLADGDARTAGVVPIGYLFLDDVAMPLGPVQAARYLFDGYLDTETYARNVFRTGRAAGPRLETDADIPQPTAERWRDAWVQAQGDPETAAPPVLGAGLRYVTDTIDPSAAQWIEARRYNATEVARLFRVPGRRIGLPSGDSRTYATARDDDADFMRTCVGAYTDPITEAWSALLPSGRNADEDVRVVLDWSALLAPTPSEQVAYLTAATSAGLMTVDEARSALGLEPLIVTEATALTAAAAPPAPALEVPA